MSVCARECEGARRGEGDQRADRDGTGRDAERLGGYTAGHEGGCVAIGAGLKEIGVTVRAELGCNLGRGKGWYIRWV